MPIYMEIARWFSEGSKREVLGHSLGCSLVHSRRAITCSVLLALFVHFTKISRTRACGKERYLVFQFQTVASSDLLVDCAICPKVVMHD